MYGIAPKKVFQVSYFNLWVDCRTDNKYTANNLKLLEFVKKYYYSKLMNNIITTCNDLQLHLPQNK